MRLKPRTPELRVEHMAPQDQIYLLDKAFFFFPQISETGLKMNKGKVIVSITFIQFNIV